MFQNAHSWKIIDVQHGKLIHKIYTSKYANNLYDLTILFHYRFSLKNLLLDNYFSESIYDITNIRVKKLHFIINNRYDESKIYNLLRLHFNKKEHRSMLEELYITQEYEVLDSTFNFLLLSVLLKGIKKISIGKTIFFNTNLPLLFLDEIEYLNLDKFSYNNIFITKESFQQTKHQLINKLSSYDIHEEQYINNYYIKDEINIFKNIKCLYNINDINILSRIKEFSNLIELSCEFEHDQVQLVSNSLLILNIDNKDDLIDDCLTGIKNKLELLQVNLYSNVIPKLPSVIKLKLNLFYHPNRLDNLNNIIECEELTLLKCNSRIFFYKIMDSLNNNKIKFLSLNMDYYLDTNFFVKFTNLKDIKLPPIHKYRRFNRTIPNEYWILN